MLMDSMQEGTWLSNAVIGSHRAQEEMEANILFSCTDSF